MNLKLSSNESAGLRLSRHLLLVTFSWVVLLLVVNFNCETQALRLERGVEEIASEAEQLKEDVKRVANNKRDDDDEGTGGNGDSRSGESLDDGKEDHEDGDSRSGEITGGEKSSGFKSESDDERGESRHIDLNWLTDLFGGDDDDDDEDKHKSNRAKPQPNKLKKPPTLTAPKSNPTPKDPSNLQYNATMTAWIKDIKKKRQALIDAKKPLDSIGAEDMKKFDQLIDEKTGDVKLPRFESAEKMFAMVDFLMSIRRKIDKLKPPVEGTNVSTTVVKEQLRKQVNELVRLNVTLDELRKTGKLSEPETKALDVLVDLKTMKPKSVDSIDSKKLEELLKIVVGIRTKANVANKTTPKPPEVKSTTPTAETTATKKPETGTSTSTSTRPDKTTPATKTPGASTSTKPDGTTTTNKPGASTSKRPDGTTTTNKPGASTSKRPDGTTTTNKPGASTSKKPADTTTTMKPDLGTSTSPSTTTTTPKTSMKPPNRTSTTTTMKPTGETTTKMATTMSPVVEQSNGTSKAPVGSAKNASISPTTTPTTLKPQPSGGSSSSSSHSKYEFNSSSTSLVESIVKKMVSLNDDKVKYAESLSDDQKKVLGEAVDLKSMKLKHMNFSSKQDLDQKLQTLQKVEKNVRNLYERSSKSSRNNSTSSTHSTKLRLNETAMQSISRMLKFKIILNEDGSISNANLTKAEKDLFSKVVDVKGSKIKIPDFSSVQEMDEFVRTFQEIGSKFKKAEENYKKQGVELENLGSISASKRKLLANTTVVQKKSTTADSETKTSLSGRSGLEEEDEGDRDGNEEDED